MIDTTSDQRSEESTPESGDSANSLPSNVRKAAPSTAKGRKHPATIGSRLSYATKGRAKDIARARGVSLCQFVREAVQEAVRSHADAS